MAQILYFLGFVPCFVQNLGKEKTDNLGKEKLICRGYEIVAYPSDLDLEVHKKYETLRCDDRRRRNYDLTYLKNAEIIYPSENYNIDIPDDDTYYKLYKDVQAKCIQIIDHMAKICQFDFHYAFNLHDQDVNKDGIFLENHFHIYIWTEDSIRDPEWDTYLNNLRSWCASVFNHIRVIACDYEWHNHIKSHEIIHGKEIVNTYTRVNAIKYVDGALRYLIHVDNNSKAKYKLEDCCSDVDLSRHKAFKEIVEDGKLNWLIDQINMGKVRSMIHLSNIARDNECTNTYRKNYYMLKDIIYSYCGFDPFMKAYGFTNQTSPEDVNKMISDYNEKRLKVDKENLL